MDYSQNSESQYVQGIDVYVTEEYGSKLYDSCKDVKFAATNTRAMDFIGGGASNYTGELSQSIFIERNGNLFLFLSYVWSPARSYLMTATFGVSVFWLYLHPLEIQIHFYRKKVGKKEMAKSEVTCLHNDLRFLLELNGLLRLFQT